MNNWEKKVLEEMELSLQGVRERDLRFFRIDELKRNISRVAGFSAACPDCRNVRSEIESAMVHLNEAIQVPGQHRREADRLIARLGRHMMKAHRLYPPWHFTYLYSFYGIVTGTLFFLPLVYLLPETHWEILAAGFVAGLITGQFTGGKKDRAVRHENRLM